jgi:hypothetical protein
LFARERIRQVDDVVAAKAALLTTLDRQCGEVFRKHPFYESPDLVSALRQLVASPDFQRATELR